MLHSHHQHHLSSGSRVLFTILLLVLCAWPGVVSAQEPPNDAVKRADVLEFEGMRAYIRGNHAQAIAYWEAAISHHPSGALYQNLALAYLAVGEIDAARRAADLASSTKVRPLTPSAMEDQRELLARISRVEAKGGEGPREPLLEVDDGNAKRTTSRTLTLDEIESHDELGTEALFAEQEENARNELRRARVARMHAEAARTNAEAELIYREAADLRSKQADAHKPSNLAGEQLAREDAAAWSGEDAPPEPRIFYAGVGATTLGVVGLGTALFLSGRVRQTIAHPDFYESETLNASARRDRSVGLGALMVGSGMIAVGASLIYYERALRTKSSGASATLRVAPDRFEFSYTF